MQLKFPLLVVFFLGTAAITTKAQSTASTGEGTLNQHSLTSTDSENNPDWTFFLDKENKVYFIDFETINVNLSDIKILNEKGDIVLADKLWDLPVDTIYEVNLRDFKPGNYKIELRSYTGLIQKDVVVSE